MTFTSPKTLLICLAVSASLPHGAAAQEGHPRRARAMSLTHETAAVWLEDDRVWIPSTGIDYVSACVGRCLPIVERRACEPPECPGHGTLLVAAGALGSIDDFPDDIDDFEAELEAMRADGELAAIAGSFGRHPDHDLDEDDGGGALVTLSIGGIVASQSRGDALFGGIGSAGLVYRLDVDEAFADPEGDGGFFATMLGDRFGIETRVRVFSEPGAQRLTYGIGGAFVLENRVEGSMWQVPSVLGLFLPELGAFTRDGRTSFYAGFGLPMKIFATRSVGIQVRAEVLVVSKLEDDAAGALLSLSLQGALQ